MWVELAGALYFVQPDEWNIRSLASLTLLAWTRIKDVWSVFLGDISGRILHLLYPPSWQARISAHPYWPLDLRLRRMSRGVGGLTTTGRLSEIELEPGRR